MFIRRVPIGPLETNAYIIAHEPSHEALVIDPGGPPASLLDLLTRHSLKLQAIVNTHGHGDHIVGNQELKGLTGAPVWVHQADAPMLTDAAASLLSWTDPTARADASWAPDRELREGEVIVLGAGHADAVNLRVVHMPGHTPGGIALVGEGLVFSGDSLFAGSIGRTDFPGGSMRQLMAAIHEKLLSLPDDTVVYPGHGPETTIGEERRYNPFLQGR